MNPYERLHRAMSVQGLTPAQKGVLVALVAHVDEAGRCWPSEPLLAAYASCSERSVRDAISALSRRGLVRVTRRGAMGNLYVVDLAALPPRHRVRHLQPAAIAGESGSDCRSERQSLHPQPAAIAAKEHKERPSEEPQENHTGGDGGDREVRVEAAHLVRVFHRDVRRLDGARPLAKELAFAEELIREHGRDGAWDITSYAVEAAKRTRFEMATFGAVRQYVAEAIARIPAPTPPRPPPAWPLDPPLTREEAEALAMGIADAEWLDRGYSDEQVAELTAEAERMRADEGGGQPVNVDGPRVREG